MYHAYFGGLIIVLITSYLFICCNLMYASINFRMIVYRGATFKMRLGS